MKRFIVCCSLIFAMSGCVFTSSDSQSADSSITYPDSIAIAKLSSVETLCFEEKVGKDVTTVRLIIEGDSVTGSMEWLPWEKDRATGTLKGVKNGNEIVADYAYTIEGSNQLEEIIFLLETDKLLIKSGELQDKDGKLSMKDPAKATIGQTLVKVTCK